MVSPELFGNRNDMKTISEAGGFVMRWFTITVIILSGMSSCSSIDEARMTKHINLIFDRYDYKYEVLGDNTRQVTEENIVMLGEPAFPALVSVIVSPEAKGAHIDMALRCLFKINHNRAVEEVTKALDCPKITRYAQESIVSALGEVATQKALLTLSRLATGKYVPEDIRYDALQELKHDYSMDVELVVQTCLEIVRSEAPSYLQYLSWDTIGISLNLDPTHPITESVAAAIAEVLSNHNSDKRNVEGAIGALALFTNRQSPIAAKTIEMLISMIDRVATRQIREHIISYLRNETNHAIAPDLAPDDENAARIKEEWVNWWNAHKESGIISIKESGFIEAGYPLRSYYDKNSVRLAITALSDFRSWVHHNAWLLLARLVKDRTLSKNSWNFPVRPEAVNEWLKWWEENKDYLHLDRDNETFGVDDAARERKAPIEPYTGKPLTKEQTEQLRKEEAEFEKLLQEMPAKQEEAWKKQQQPSEEKEKKEEK
jgi:hypothetical protein